MSSSSHPIPRGAALAGCVLAAAMLLAPPAPADDLLQLMPFETFECEGEECPADFAEADGQDAAAAGLIAESRSEAGAFGQTRIGHATVGVRFQVCEPTRARIAVRGDYLGRLRGSWGGFNNRAVMDLFGVLRNLTTGEVLDRNLIQREEERGTVGHSVTTFIPQNNLPQGDGADTTGIIVEGDLLAGHVYMAGIELRTLASGAAPRAYADLKSGNFRTRMFFLRIELEPELEDSDGDGLFDVWETEGLKDCEGNVIVDLPAFGAEVGRKDVFVEYDWLPGSEPSRDDIEFVKSRFAAAPGDSGVDRISNPDGSQGINLWIDTGSLQDFGTLVGDDLGGGGPISLDDVPNGRSIARMHGDADGDGIADFREVKDLYFDKARRAIFHYAISGPPGVDEGGPEMPGVGDCSDGVDNDGDGLTDGEDELDCFGGGQAAGGANFFVSSAGAGTFMHELGHTLGLGHGGHETNNCKPNYLSMMNYVYSGGVPRDDDGDGVFESETENYSPLPLPTGGRVTAPLGDLVENQLDESAIVDGADPVHGIRWVDGNGIGRTSAIDVPVDWNGNGTIQGDVDGNGIIDADETLVRVNLNRGDETGSPAKCEQASADAGHPANETLRGNDDWHTIVFRFTPDSAIEGDDIVNVIEEPVFDPAAIEATFNATDLVVVKTVDPDPWVGGQEVAYNFEVTNNGPNGAAAAVLVDMPPEGVRFVEPPEACIAADDGSLACTLEQLSVGETVRLSLAARMPIATDCGRQQFKSLSNTAEVRNGIGRELAPADNRTTVRHAILCPILEYPAKFVCGVEPDPADRGLLRSTYGTSVNLHNPHDEEVFVFAKLALARPARPLTPGEVLPIDLFSFDYDESIVVDCDIVEERLFPDGFPDGLVDGFLILQTARNLDVVAVHTAGTLGAVPEEPAQVTQTSIDVERVAERRREPPTPLPDLAITILASDLVCDTAPLCDLDLRYQVENIGDADAGPFTVIATLGGPGLLAASDAWPEGLAVSTSETRPLSLAVPQGALAEGIDICLGADQPDDVVEELEEANNEDCRVFATP